MGGGSFDFNAIDLEDGAHAKSFLFTQLIRNIMGHTLLVTRVPESIL